MLTFVVIYLKPYEHILKVVIIETKKVVLIGFPDEIGGKDRGR